MGPLLGWKVGRSAGHHEEQLARDVPIPVVVVAERRSADAEADVGHRRRHLGLRQHRVGPHEEIPLPDQPAQAAGALLALYEAGLTVPGDVSVVGYDDLPISRYTIPPLTTMHQPIYHMGERAADIVIDQIERKIEEVVHVHLQAQLVERKTCCAPKYVGQPE